MYNSVLGSALVCQSLQRCVAHKGWPWKPSVPVSKCPDAGRWYSAVGTRIQEDDVAIPTVQGTGIIRSARSPGRITNKAIRHWRPPKTANLGIDVLGKPAEVLILPSRDRKILRAPVPEESSKNTGIQESLDSELQPVSWEDVQKNIEAIRTELSGDTIEVGLGDWRKAKRNLTVGFTKGQLKTYIFQSSWAESVPDTKDDHELVDKNKPYLATLILKSVWNLKVKSETGIVQIGERSVDTHIKKIQTSTASLDMVLMDTTQPLRIISEQHQVQLDVFREQGKVELYGHREAVSKAHKQLQKLLHSLVQESIILDTNLRQLLGDQHMQDDLISMLSQKHGLHIERQQDKLHVVARQAEHIGLVRRDLYLASEIDGTHVGSCVWPMSDLSQTVVVPVYPPSSRRWFSERLDWHRHVAKEMPHNSHKSLTSTESRKLKATCRLAYDRLAVAEKDALSLYSETIQLKDLGVQQSGYIFDLGQALFTTPQDTLKVPGHTRARSAFMSEIPYLPQTLSSMTAVVGKKNNMPDSDQPSLVRIRLQPLHRSNLLPTFELLLLGRKGSQGLQQPLQMRKVSAIFSTQLFNVLLPSSVVDIRVSKTSKYELFDSTRSVSNAQYLRLLKEFASCVDKLQNSQEKGFDPRLNLNLSSLIQHAKSSVQAGPAVGAGSNASVTNTYSVSDSAQETLPGYDTDLIDYIIEPPEILDTRLYKLPQGSTSFLEHIFADAGPHDAPRYRESLQIVHDPISHFLVDKNPPHRQETREGFDALLQTAVDMAMVLGSHDKAPKKNNV